MPKKGSKRPPPDSFISVCEALLWPSFGVHGARETPVPIPNTEVKPRSGYYTWQIKAWENSTMPNYR